MIIRLAKLRKERSAEAARARRNKENGEYDNIKKLLPIDESKFKEHRTVRGHPNFFDVRTRFFWCQNMKVRVLSSYKNKIEHVPRTVFVFLAELFFIERSCSCSFVGCSTFRIWPSDYRVYLGALPLILKSNKSESTWQESGLDICSWHKSEHVRLFW